MDVQSFGVTQEQAIEALKEYKAARGRYDAADWKIERIYRAIAKGNTVISVTEAIRNAGVDELGRPKLAIMRADQQVAICNAWSSSGVDFYDDNRSRSKDLRFDIPWPDRPHVFKGGRLQALVPRIPPQHRPANLAGYHILWEADWMEVPRDPFLLKRLAEDAWVVVAAWDLTDVEVSVIAGIRAKGRS